MVMERVVRHPQYVQTQPYAMMLCVRVCSCQPLSLLLPVCTHLKLATLCTHSARLSVEGGPNSLAFTC